MKPSRLYLLGAPSLGTEPETLLDGRSSAVASFLVASLQSLPFWATLVPRSWSHSREQKTEVRPSERRQQAGCYRCCRGEKFRERPLENMAPAGEACCEERDGSGSGSGSDRGWTLFDVSERNEIIFDGDTEKLDTTYLLLYVVTV